MRLHVRTDLQTNATASKKGPGRLQWMKHGTFLLRLWVADRQAHAASMQMQAAQDAEITLQ